MEDWLITAAEYATRGIETVAMLVVVFGTIEAVVASVRGVAEGGDPLGQRDVWVRYGHWLVAALALQLGADIIETSISPTWEDLGRLAAVAVLRTFLDYFLVRDLKEA